MARAALVPYLGGRAGLVIADDETRPLLARAWDVGELRPNPNAALERDHAFLRAVEPHHVHALLEDVIRQILDHGVVELLVEEARGGGVAAGWSTQIGAAVVDNARACGISVEYRPRVSPAASGEVTAIRHAAALLELVGSGSGAGAPPTPRSAALPALAVAPVAPPLGAPPLPPPQPCVIGYDLGSADLGVTVLADALPLNVIHAVTIGVDPENLDAVVAVAVELALRVGATRAAIEHGVKFRPPYFTIPAGSTPAQTNAILARHRAQTASMAQQHVICGDIQKRLTIALSAAGIEAVTWARESWAHRVVQHHQGGMSNVVAHGGLRQRCGAGSWERLRNDHERDAAGVACMWLVEPPARPKRPSRSRSREAADAAVKALLTPEQKVARRVGQWRESKRAHPVGGRPVDASAAERAALGCTCTAKHRLGCRVLEERLRRQVEGARAHGSALRPDVFK